MSDKEDKKKEEQDGIKKHKDKIIELMGGTEIIDNYIEAVSQRADTVVSENQKDVIQSIFKLEKKYDLIIITDLFEVSSDIYELLKTTRDKLNNNGKILISTINPKWRRVLRFSEIINIKKQIRKSSNTKLKKIVSSARSSGLELNYFYTKQIFPFKLLGFGRVLNKALEHT